VYIVTAATYRHVAHFRGREQRLHDALLALALELGWRLEAWAVFANHYHFIGVSPADPGSLRVLIRRLHAGSATAINRQDDAPGRRVWSNYWDTLITNQTSYLARLSYVHQNAVKHGLAPHASAYPWCSASWFEANATSAMVATVYSFGTEGMAISDVDCGA
jgi:putative transposase